MEQGAEILCQYRSHCFWTRPASANITPASAPHLPLLPHQQLLANGMYWAECSCYKSMSLNSQASYRDRQMQASYLLDSANALVCSVFLNSANGKVPALLLSAFRNCSAAAMLVRCKSMQLSHAVSLTQEVCFQTSCFVLQTISCGSRIAGYQFCEVLRSKFVNVLRLQLDSKPPLMDNLMCK